MGIKKIDLKQIPKTPGIYKFFSADTIIYIGKAKNLKIRVSSYFGNSLKDRKTQQIHILTDRVETFSTQSEAEALLLEQSLIKENLPRFNILLRDDKTYPYIHFSMKHKFPGISMRRSKHSVSSDYFGPFISVQAVKATIKDLQKIYQIRNCSDSTFSNRSRPCIEHQMQRCSAPCVKLINPTNYMEDISSSQSYLSSTGRKTKNLMTQQMKKYSDQQDFEQANDIKKRIETLDLLQQEQSSVSNLTSTDLFTCISAHGRTGACILAIRDGKIRGTKTYYFKDNLMDDLDSLFQSLIFFYYQNTFSLPEKIILTLKPTNLTLIQEAIDLKFNQPIEVSAQIPSTAKQLVKLALLNARQVVENKIQQSDKYQHAINDLATQLKIDNNSKITIEGYDISHHAGEFAVGSIVKFTDAGPDKKSYKLFNIPESLSGNDIGSIQHVLERRLMRINENPLPTIMLIDGGSAQLNIALKVLDANNSKSSIILSIVKGSKRVRATETILSRNGIFEMPKDSPGFIFLQQIRDESHRFAITNNRKKKNRSVKYSSLDGIQGLGPIKKKNLLKFFNSIKAIKIASKDQLCMVEGISIKLAEEIKKTLD